MYERSLGNGDTKSFVYEKPLGRGSDNVTKIFEPFGKKIVVVRKFVKIHKYVVNIRFHFFGGSVGTPKLFLWCR